MHPRITIVLVALALAACDTREGHAHLSEESGGGAEVGKPRIGGAFTDWIPLLTQPVNSASHVDNAHRGVLWSHVEDERGQLCGEAIQGVRIFREDQPLGSEVLYVEVQFHLTTPPHPELAFRRLATHLFGADLSSEWIETDPQHGEVQFFRFGDLGTACLYTTSGQAQLRSKICERRESDIQQQMAEQDGADQPAPAPESMPEDKHKPKPESEGRFQ